MLKADTLAELENLLEKHRAKAESKLADGSLTVVTVCFGHYRATGNKGNIYDCFAGRDFEGKFWVSCVCKGGLHNGGCYHEAAVFYLHKELAQKMIDEKRRADNKAMDNSMYISGGGSRDKKKPEKLKGGMRI